MLSRELGTHLTGRYYQVELYPFSFREFLKLTGRFCPETSIMSTQESAGLKAGFNEYFSKGGFPAYLKSENKQYLKSLYESILYRDVMVRNGLIDAFGCYGLNEGLILTDSEEDLFEQDGYRITVKPVWKWLLSV